MKDGMEIDTRELRDALRLYSRATKKDESTIVNDAMLTMLVHPRFGVSKATPKANASEIQKELTSEDKIALKLAAEKLAGTSGTKSKTGKTLKSQTWQKRVGKEAKSIIGKRKRSVGYFQSGWIALIKKFGGKRNTSAKFTNADNHDYKKSTESTLSAFIENTSKGIGQTPKAVQALRRAVSGTAKDRVKYATNKLQKTADKFTKKGGKFI